MVSCGCLSVPLGGHSYGLGPGAGFGGPCSDNCQRPEAVCLLAHFWLHLPVVQSFTVTAKAKGFLSFAWVWFWCWTQGGRAKQWQRPGKGESHQRPRTHMHTNCLPGGRECRGLKDCLFNPKDTPQYQRHMKLRLLILILSPLQLIWFLFWANVSRYPRSVISSGSLNA